MFVVQCYISVEPESSVTPENKSAILKEGAKKTSYNINRHLDIFLMF